MLSIARQKSRRIVGFSSSRIVKLRSRLSRLQRSSFLVGGFRVILVHILRISLLIRIFVLMFFDVIHVIQKHERHALKASMDFPNFLSGRLSTEHVGECIASKLNKSFLFFIWFGHAVVWFIRSDLTLLLTPPCLRQENFLYSDSESQSDPLGCFEIRTLPSCLVPADRSVVPKTKNTG